MKTIRNLACILAVVICSAAAVSCDSVPDPAPETTEFSVTSAVETVSDVLISADTGQDYVLIRGDSSGDGEQELLRSLYAAILLETGVDLAVKTDWYRDDKGAPPQAREILLGETNREESLAAQGSFGETDMLNWIVRRVGEKLVICAGSDEALEDAVAYVIENYLKDGVLSVPAGLDILYEPQWPLDAIRIGENDITGYRIVVSARGEPSVLSCAERIRDYVYGNTGHMLTIVTDAETPQDCEILVGETNRRTSADDAAAYGYSAAVEGSTLVFTGDPIMLPLAVQAFTEGGMGDIAGEVYTVHKNASYSAQDIMDPEVIRAMKAYTDIRAEMGRASHLEAHRKNA